MSSPSSLKVFLRSSYFFLYFCISIWLNRTLFYSLSITDFSSFKIIFSRVIFSSSIYSLTWILVWLYFKSSSTSSYNCDSYFKLWSISPNFNSTFATFNLTFFIVIWDASNFFYAILRELLNNLSAYEYCSFS